MYAARLALRTRSSAAREALARSMPGVDLGDADLMQLALEERLPSSILRGRSGRVLAALALTWAGQARGGSELEAAALTYRTLWADGARPDLPPPHHQLAAQTLFLTGRDEEVRTLLPLLTRLPAGMQPFLDADLAHPSRGTARSEPAQARHRAWEELLSRPFTEHGLAPVRVHTAGNRDRPLFDRLHVPDVAPRSVDGPSVTVVVPCFRPDEGLLTSVASLAAQSYGPMQILLVDDASGPDFEEWFDRAVALDDRVRLVRRGTNGGSYLSRNDALRAATGALITFQDADDWSHPQRIAAQVDLLGSRPDAPACRTLAVRADDDLTHQWLGYQPVRIHASSLMLRAEVGARLGDFLRVRKGADSEYVERIDAEVGRVASTRTPLAVYRLRAGSLSREDLTFHWAAPERLAFKGTYRAWQRAGRHHPFPAPVPFVRGIEQDRVVDHLGTAYLSDFSTDPTADPGHSAPAWDLPAGPASSRTGLWHLESPRSLGEARPEMHDRWFDRIVREPAWQPLSRTEPVHVERLVVLDPTVLVLQGDQECAVTAGLVQVHLRAEDEELSGDVAAVVRSWFGHEPEWVRPD